MAEMNRNLRIEKGKVELVELPMPHPREGFVLVEQEYAPVCVEQRPYANGFYEFYEDSLHLGHEGVGVVVEVGPGVTSAIVGDRVIVYQFWPCGDCWVCQHGLGPTHCMRCRDFRDIEDFNASAFGSGGSGFNQYRLAPVSMIQKIPDSLDFKYAAGALCLIGCTYTPMQEHGVTPGHYALVAGVGFIGHAAIANLKYRGARVIALGRNRNRMDMAKSMGADVIVNPDDCDWLEQVCSFTPQGRGVDISFECSGYPYYQHRCIAALRHYGTCVLLGYAPHEPLVLDLRCEPELMRGKKFLAASFDVHFNDRLDLIELLQDPWMQARVDQLVTDIFPMSKAREAFDKILAGQAGKVYLRPGE